MQKEIDIIKIGNSQGIRIPKAVLEQCGFNGSLNMRVEGEAIILTKAKRKARKPREGWAEAIKRDIEQYGVPENLWPDGIVNEFDKTEWTWPGGEQ